jgi:hypothetical protein
VKVLSVLSLTFSARRAQFHCAKVFEYLLCAEGHYREVSKVSSSQSREEEGRGNHSLAHKAQRNKQKMPAWATQHRRAREQPRDTSGVSKSEQLIILEGSRDVRELGVTEGYLQAPGRISREE